MTNFIKRILLSFIVFLIYSCEIQAQKPNILLVIADDLGVDYTKGYHSGDRMPTTPTLDSLRAVGITYENVFSAPKCTPTRAAIMSGKHGVKTGVVGTPGNLSSEHRSIFKAIEAETDNSYSDALIGKWHLTSPVDELDPYLYGPDYYYGFLNASVEDYFAWTKTENGSSGTVNNYVTSELTDRSIDWINDQEQPWFLWLAHAAPHSPFQTPPDHLYTTGNVNNNKGKYIASIEAIDAELNRLLHSISQEDRDNLLILFVGDNGTPETVLQDYPGGHGKSTLYQGGVRVPLIVAGLGVSRTGEKEPALINVADIYATILESTGISIDGGLENSLSFYPTFNGDGGPRRIYNYTEVGQEGDNNGWAIRNNQYKLIQFDDNRQELYDLIADSLETNELISIGLTAEQEVIKNDLLAEGMIRRDEYSCIDQIQNGDEEGVDCGGKLCISCTTSANDINTDISLKLAPNPVNGLLEVKINNENIENIQIFNDLGQIMFKQNIINHADLTIDTTDFPKGVYVIKVSNLVNSKLSTFLKI